MMRRSICFADLKAAVGMAKGLLRQLGTDSGRIDARTNIALRHTRIQSRHQRRAPPRRALEEETRVASVDVGFGFSAGGLLFPYFVGVAASLDADGLLTRETKVAGSSAGSLISALYHSGMTPEEMMEGCLRVSADCRANGTRGRLRTVLRAVTEELLPDDAHLNCTGKAFVAITRLYPFGNELISDFETREDLIEALLTSCHVPLWFDNSLMSDFRESLCMDGGLTNLIPTPPVARPIRISCFPMEGWGETYRVKIAPDRYRESKYNVQELLSMALQPGNEEQLFELFEMGIRDARDYADQYTVPSIDEDSGREFLLDEEDVPRDVDANLWSRMRSVFIQSRKEATVSLSDN